MKRNNKKTKLSTPVLVCALIGIGSHQLSTALASPIAIGRFGAVATDAADQSFARITSIVQLNGIKESGPNLGSSDSDMPDLTSLFGGQFYRDKKIASPLESAPGSKNFITSPEAFRNPAQQPRNWDVSSTAQAKAQAWTPLSRQELDLLKNIQQMSQAQMDHKSVLKQISLINSISADTMRRIYNAAWSPMMSAIKRRTLRLASSKVSKPDAELLSLVSRQKNSLAQLIKQNKALQREDFGVLEEMEQTFLKNMYVHGIGTPRGYKETLPQTVGAFRILESRNKPKPYLLQILRNTPFENRLEPEIFTKLLNQYSSKSQEFWSELNRLAPREKWYVDALKRVAGVHLKSGNRLSTQEAKKNFNF